MSTNIRSIMNINKREEVGLLLQENDVDICGITESWTHEQIEDAEIQYQGYTLFRRDRDKRGMRGGGFYYMSRMTLMQLD